jgi:hypothetical protein
MCRIALLILLALSVLSFIKHPFYLSITELKYNPEEKKMNCSMRVFLNDFENSLKKIHKAKVDLNHPPDSALLIKQLSDYIKEHISVNIDGKPLKFQVLGFEREEENFWVYFESEQAGIPKKVVVENSILYEHLKEQVNLVRVHVNGKEQSWKLRYPDKQHTAEF